MKRSLVVVMVTLVIASIALAFASCTSGRERRAPDSVPKSWRDVRASAGHTVHVGGKANVACRDCHGSEGKFESPPAAICESCHGTVTTPLHRANLDCQSCHGFGKDLEVTPTACMRCHEQSQGWHVKPVGAHAEQPCGDCHRAHQSPSLQAQPCTSCHEDQQRTNHAGTRGCLDCHEMHEPLLSADAGCARCHAQQKGRLRVTERAITAQHPKCTTCHTPHTFEKAAVATCTSCHEGKPVLARAKHGACESCHAPHDGAKATSCVSCHTNERVLHPPPTRIVHAGGATTV
ncbi:MAG TPA: hypothetical protein VK427_12975, partial [Kofleriaceae bacterium]|nr:hypothetical protein [Kofleriaceae bacterium]